MESMMNRNYTIINRSLKKNVTQTKQLNKIGRNVMDK